MLLARPSAVFRALRGDSARAVPPVVITTGPHPGEALLDEVLIQAVAAGRPFALALLRLVDLTDGEAAATSLSLANATDVTTELVNAVLGPGERVVRRGPYE